MRPGRGYLSRVPQCLEEDHFSPMSQFLPSETGPFEASWDPRDLTGTSRSGGSEGQVVSFGPEGRLGDQSRGFHSFVCATLRKHGLSQCVQS